MDFGFAILDFGLGGCAATDEVLRLQSGFAVQSKIQNLKSKIGGSHG
jgi:hypothetical protein